MSRRAPRGGYQFPEKQAYREEIWCAIAAQIGALVHDAHVLIMPSKEGAEIPVLLSLGFREKHIHAVDENPALIASAPWREMHPDVQVYGNELARAMERIAEKGVKLMAANFDLCGCFSSKTIDALREGAETGALADTAVIGLTMLKGRESTETIASLRIVSELLANTAMSCDMRLDIALRVMVHGDPSYTTLLRSGEYRSNTQQMVWALATVVRKDAIKREWCLRGLPFQKELLRLAALRNELFSGGRQQRYSRLNKAIDSLETWLKSRATSLVPFPRLARGSKSGGWDASRGGSHNAYYHADYNDCLRYSDRMLPFCEWQINTPSRPAYDGPTYKCYHRWEKQWGDPLDGMPCEVGAA